MTGLKTLNVATELLGMPVLDPNTARLHGRVTEAIVNPSMGTLVGLLMETPSGEERAVAGEGCYFFGKVGAVLTPEHAVSNPAKLADHLSAGVAVNRDLLGAQVVTEKGEELGYVAEIHLCEERHKFIYRIARSRLQELWCDSFFIPGRLPLRWLQESRQLIVPA
jgi:sporulation protein YlmC with PRC-barrel domain